MLLLSLASGEYLTIGDDMVIQLQGIRGDHCKLSLHAPKEITILRGEVHERNGGERPECVYNGPRWHKHEIPWNRSKAQALSAMRKLLSQMDGRDENVRTLRRQLEHMFPSEPEQSQVSNG